MCHLLVLLLDKVRTVACSYGVLGVKVGIESYPGKAFRFALSREKPAKSSAGLKLKVVCQIASIYETLNVNLKTISLDC